MNKRNNKEHLRKTKVEDTDAFKTTLYIHANGTNLMKLACQHGLSVTL